MLNVELKDVHPLGTGTTSLPRRFTPLLASDGALYQAYRSKPPSYLPRVVHRRYRVAGRTARVVWTSFSEEFCIAVSEGIWPIATRTFVGDDVEWYCLGLRLSGDTFETIDGQDHRIGPDTCYLVRYAPGLTHVLRSVSDRLMSEVCIIFRPNVLADRVGLSRDDIVSRLHPEGNPWYSDSWMTSEMEHLVRRLRQASPTTPSYGLTAESTALELLGMYLSQMLDGATRSTVSSSVSRIERVRRYLEETYDSVPVLEDVAAMVGLSPRKLARDFMRSVGSTVHDYHRDHRMEIAKSLDRKSVV